MKKLLIILTMFLFACASTSQQTKTVDDSQQIKTLDSTHKVTAVETKSGEYIHFKTPGTVYIDRIEGGDVSVPIDEVKRAEVVYEKKESGVLGFLGIFGIFGLSIFLLGLIHLLNQNWD